MSRPTSSSIDFHPDEYVTERTLEERTQISTRHWQRLRQTGDGPKYVVVGPRCIRYRWGAVREFMEARACGSGRATPNRGDAVG
jgi:predicted DNA-binding transcriptional regulator AlpA